MVRASWRVTLPGPVVCWVSCLLAVFTVGCGNSADGDRKTNVGRAAAATAPSAPAQRSSGLKAPATGDTAVTARSGRRQAAVLHLPRGRTSAKYTIIALSPRTHTYDVRIETAASADVSVHMRTWYGVSLGVVDSTRGDQFCKVVGVRTTCFLPFPRLEAQRAGRWTVIASKYSVPPATVHVSVTFSR